MAEYLTRALAARNQNPAARRGLLQAMAQRQTGGEILSGLTGGRMGRQLMSGPSPTEMYASLAEQDRAEARENFLMERMVERDRIADEQFQTKLQADLAATLAKSGTKPSAKERQNYQANLRASSRIRQIRDKTDALTSSEASELDSPWYEITSRAMLPASVKRRADEGWYSENTEEILKLGSQLESDIRRAFAGTAVTRYEQQDTQEWSPMAPGLSQAQRQQRWNLIENDLAEAEAIYGELYPNYTVDDLPDVSAPENTNKVVNFEDL